MLMIDTVQGPVELMVTKDCEVGNLFYVNSGWTMLFQDENQSSHTLEFDDANKAREAARSITERIEGARREATA